MNVENNSKKLNEAFSYIDDRYLNLVDDFQSERDDLYMKESKEHRKPRKILAYAAVAAVLLTLTTAAFASGRLPSIFNKMFLMSENSPEDAEFFLRAEEANTNAEPVTVSVPEPDYAALTFRESYYDGENLTLGINIDKVLPDPVIGFEPGKEMIDKIHKMQSCGTFAFISVSPDDPTDNIDFWRNKNELSETEGVGLTQEDYNEILESRSENAKVADLRSQSSIMMDNKLKETLTEAEYNSFWELLKKNGHACVMISSIYPGDHVKLDDGSDLGQTGWTELDDGMCLTIMPVSENARGLDKINGKLTLYSSAEYWYMELNGPAYIVYSRDNGTQVPFSVCRSEK